MRVPKKLAIVGFNLCASAFIGFCVYGLLLYAEEAKRPAASPLFTGLVGLGVLGCIAGICYFGRQWDRRNAEEAREKKPSPPM